MSSGIIMYNVSTKMLVRLAVCLRSLRDVYHGPVLILSEETRGEHKHVAQIGRRYDADVMKVVFRTSRDLPNATYLNACLAAEHTPWDNTLWLDSDTIVLKDPSEMFENAEHYDFAIAHFSTWLTSIPGRNRPTKIGKRILNWKRILPDYMIDAALAFGPAINCGVFAWNQRSTLSKVWYDTALKGRHTRIPDEVCCQILLAQHPHIIMEPDYNVSCRYGEVDNPDNVIIHYHGNKHCRYNERGDPLNGNWHWYPVFQREREFCERWVQSDRMLRKYLPVWDKR